MALRIIRVVAPIVALICLYFAWDSWDRADGLESQRDNLAREIGQLRADIDNMTKLAPKPLKQREEAVEQVITQLIDDSELLGSSVRLNIQGSGIQWTPVRFDVEKTTLSMSTADVSSAALGYAYILWQVIQRQPARVISASIAAQGEVVSISADLEVYALSGSGR
jgi:hypothetical protein